MANGSTGNTSGATGTTGAGTSAPETATAAASGEKMTLGQRLHELLMAFLYRHSLARRLDEMADQIDEAINNGTMIQEDIEKLTNVVDSLAGKLRNVSPEQIQKTEEEALMAIEHHIQQLYDKGKIVNAKVNEPDFYKGIKALSPKFDAMTDEEFKKYFNENAVLYNDGRLKTEDGKTEGTTALLIELDNECYEAEFTVSEPRVKDEANPDHKQRDVVISVSKYDGSYGDATALKNVKDGAYETMMRAFLKPRELRREEDINRLDLKKLAKENQAVHDFEIISKYKDKVVESADKRCEITYDSKTNTFRIRDKETKDMLIISGNQNRVLMDVAENTDNINDWQGKIKNANGNQSAWNYDKGRGQITYNLKFFDSSKSKLFYTPEFLEILTTKGIGTQDMLNSLERNSDKKPFGFSKTENAEALEKVDRLKNALDEVMRSKPQEDIDGLTITDNRRFAWKNKDKAAVFISIEDKKSGYDVSYNLDENGEPTRINYRKNKQDESGKYVKGRFRFLQNFQNKVYAKDFSELQNIPELARIYDIACEARNLYQSREEIIKAAVEEDKQESVNTPQNIPPEEMSAYDADELLKAIHNNNTTSYYINQLYNDVINESGKVLRGKTPSIELNKYDSKFLLEVAKIAKGISGTNLEENNLGEWLNSFVSSNTTSAADKLEKALTQSLLTKTERGSYNRAKAEYERTIKDVFVAQPEEERESGKETEKGNSEYTQQRTDDYKHMLESIKNSNREDVSLAYVMNELGVDTEEATVTYNDLCESGVLKTNGAVDKEVLEEEYKAEINTVAENERE